jgi:hypothetical protein
MDMCPFCLGASECRCPRTARATILRLIDEGDGMRLAGFAAASAVAVALLTVPGGLPAVAAESCSTADPAFCATYSIGVLRPGTTTTETRAMAPADLRLSLGNVTAGHDTIRSKWLERAKVGLLSKGGVGGFVPSRQLPALLLSGSTDACGTGSDFSACTAGHGTFSALVSDTGSEDDGYRTGTFGVQRVVNVTAPGNDNRLKWRAFVAFCVETSIGCNGGTAKILPIDMVVPDEKPADGVVRLVVPLSLAFTFRYSDTAIASTTAAIDSLTGLVIHGRSNRLKTGETLAEKKTVVHLPATCGTADISAILMSRGGARAAVRPAQTVTGCPTARLAGGPVGGNRVRLDAEGSAAHLAGRTVSAYHWDFGDGRRKTTTGPKVAHSTTERDHRMSVVVEDSAGALSASRSILIKGSDVTVHAPDRVTPGQHVTVRGRLTRWHSDRGLGGRKIVVKYCPDLNGCDLYRTLTTSSAAGSVGKFSFTFTAHYGNFYSVRFNGDEHYLSATGGINPPGY